MVISLGEALIDFISQKELDFSGFPGGSPFNTSVAVARMGIPCRFLGRMSTDLFGEQLSSYLEKNGVGTELMIRTDDATTLSFVKKQSDGQARYAFFANGTADRFWKEEDFASVVLPEEARMIHFGSISFSQEPCGTLISKFLEEKASKLFLSFDPNIRPSLVPDRAVFMERFERICRICSLIKLSDEDLEWLYPGLSHEEGVAKLLDMGIGLVAFTKGKAGARLVTPSQEIISPLYDLPVADTIGAGDTFHGALLTFLHDRGIFSREAVAAMSREDLEELGAFANKAAGINCHRSGANPPRREEMNSPEFDLP